MFYDYSGDELRLFVKLTSRASKDEIATIETIGEKSYLAIRVRALPEKGAANKALLKLLAKEFDIPVSAIRLLTGASSRLKLISLGNCQEKIEYKLKNLQEKTR